MKRTTLFGIAAVVLVIDQWSKWQALRTLPADGPVTLVPRLFDLTLVRNTGGAFGIMPHATVWLVVAAAAAIVGIIGTIVRAREPVPGILGIALALPLGGALGNLIDRVRVGHVTDFLHAHADAHEFPVFNVADSCICVGVGLLVIYYWSRPNTDLPVGAPGPPLAVDKESE